jgi:hypothetical protein
MRLIGLILVTLGVLILARQSVFSRAPAEAPPPMSDTRGDELGIPPVLGGITMTSGLILVTLGGRREDG